MTKVHFVKVLEVWVDLNNNGRRVASTGWQISDSRLRCRVLFPRPSDTSSSTAPLIITHQPAPWCNILITRTMVRSWLLSSDFVFSCCRVQLKTEMEMERKKKVEGCKREPAGRLASQLTSQKPTGFIDFIVGQCVERPLTIVRAPAHKAAKNMSAFREISGCCHGMQQHCAWTFWTKKKNNHGKKQSADNVL